MELTERQQQIFDLLTSKNFKKLTRAQLVTLQRQINKQVELNQKIVEKYWLIKHTLEIEIRKR